MGSTADIELTWGDGTHLFSLRVLQLSELQEKCADRNPLDGTFRLAGPAEIFARVVHGRWRVNDIRETIRLGLIGGGMKPAEAHALCVRYIDNRPWVENVEVAGNILSRALQGPVEEDRPGEKKGAGAGPTGTTTASSDSPSSTGSVLQ